MIGLLATFDRLPNQGALRLARIDELINPDSDPLRRLPEALDGPVGRIALGHVAARG